MREGKGKGERRRGERSLESPALPLEPFSRESFQRQRPWAPRARSGNAEYQAVVSWLPTHRVYLRPGIYEDRKTRLPQAPCCPQLPAQCLALGPHLRMEKEKKRTEGLEERARESIRQQLCTSYNLLSSVWASQAAEWYSIFLLMQQTWV